MDDVKASGCASRVHQWYKVAATQLLVLVVAKYTHIYMYISVSVQPR